MNYCHQNCQRSSPGSEQRVLIDQQDKPKNKLLGVSMVDAKWYLSGSFAGGVKGAVKLVGRTS